MSCQQDAVPAPGHLPALTGTDQVDDRDRVDDADDAPGNSESYPRLKSPATSKSHTRKRSLLSLQVHGKDKPVPCSKVHPREGIKKHGSVKDASAEVAPASV